MSQSTRRFAELLQDGIAAVAKRSSKPKSVIRDELGYAVGRKGGSAIEYWGYGDGHIPKQQSEVEALARALIDEGGLDQTWLSAFLDSAGYADSAAIVTELFPVTSNPLRNNLPLTPTRFVGRETELAELAHMIADPGCRLITLIGPGGSGKTRLATEAARKAISAFADGVVFVELAPLSSVEGVTPAMAAALHLTLDGNLTPQAQVLRYVRQQALLLVLDNFEHLLAEANRPEPEQNDDPAIALVTGILDQAPDAKMLVTSRERLNIRGEWVYDVGGLETPSVEAAASMENRVDAYSAPTLFIQTARRVQAGFAPTVADIEAILRICRVVGGMPLAIELAAAWVRVLSCNEIAEEIEESLGLFATTQRDLSPRHRSMQAVFDHSWKLLSAEEQKVFAGCSVFRGGFTREAAVVAAGASLPLLAALTDKSLLRRNRQARYEIHELARQFGAGKLRGMAAREQAARDRHCAFFYDYLKQQEADLFGARQQAAIAKVQDEIVNIQSAWHWAVNQCETENGDYLDRHTGLLEPEKSIKMLSTLLEYYRISGSFYDAIVLLNGMLELQSRTPIQNPRIAFWIAIGLSEFYGHIRDFQRSETYVRQAETLLGEPFLHDKNAQAEQAVLTCQQGYMHFRSDPIAAIELFHQSIQMYEGMGDDISMVRVRHGLARAARNVGDFDLAHQTAQCSLALSIKLDNPLLQIESLLVKGSVAYAIGHFEKAEESFQESLLQLRRMKHPRLLDMGLIQLCNNQKYAGRFEQALETYHEWQRLSEKIDGSISRLKDVEVGIRIHLGQYDSSASLVSEKMRITRDVGNNGAAPGLYRSLCMLALEKGDIAAAKSYTKSFGDFGLWQMHPPIDQILFGLIAALESNLEQAREHIVHAFDQNIDRRHLVVAGAGLAVAACVCVLDNQPAHALSLYATSCKIPFVANSRWFTDVIGKRITSGVSSLPREAVVEAQARGRTLDIWAAVDETLTA